MFYHVFERQSYKEIEEERYTTQVPETGREGQRERKQRQIERAHFLVHPKMVATDEAKLG